MIIFSARLDETGTDEISPYTTVGGAVATVEQWDKLEAAWDRLLARYKVSAYHWIEFNHRKGDFKGWSRLKCGMFVKAQERIIRNSTMFRVAVGVHDATHIEVKKKMAGTKKFPSESSYSLCLRYLMNMTCELLEKKHNDFCLNILLEKGPWTNGAMDTFERERTGRGKINPAPYAHRYGDFRYAKKGKYRSLEAADYIVRDAHIRMTADRPFPKHVRARYRLLKQEDLEWWYGEMEKITKAMKA